MCVVHVGKSLRDEGLPTGAPTPSQCSVDPATAARARRRFAYFLGFLAVSAVVAFFNLRGVRMTPDGLRASVLGWGALAPLVYIAIVALRPFIFFPSTVLFIVAGLAFGPWKGTLYAVIGGVIAAVVSFLLARSLGREFVQARLPPRLQQMQETEWGAGLIFILLLVPIVPMTAVNYGAGLSRVSLGHYVLAVVGALTPRAFAYCFFGDSLFDIGSPQFIAALVLLALMVVVPALLRRRWMSHWR